MIDILRRIEFENNCWVGLVDSLSFNIDKESRARAVTDMASITKGRLGFKEKEYTTINGGIIPEGIKISSALPVSKNRQNLYDRLLIESAGKPSVPFEFVPIMFQETLENITESDLNHLYSNSTVMREEMFTNLRGILKSTYPHMFEQYNTREQVEGFKIIIGRVPIKVISHLRTHRAFSFLVESSRNKRYLNELEFWYPSWWDKDFIIGSKALQEQTLKSYKKVMKQQNMKPEEVTMELSDRRLVTFAMCAWEQDANAWDNLFAVRGKRSGTQSITGETVKHIKTLLI